MLASCLVCSSILKLEETCSSETLVDFERNRWRCIPEDRTIRKLKKFHLRRGKGTQYYSSVILSRQFSDVCVAFTSKQKFSYKLPENYMNFCIIFRTVIAFVFVLWLSRIRSFDLFQFIINF